MKRRNQILGIVISVIMILTMIPAISFGAGLPFTDVPADAWYYNDVQSAYDSGLINGRTATSFAPNANMTYAEAVKLAACMHQKYTEGSVTLTTGSPNWWDSYVEYAFANGIIGKTYDWNQTATRAGYVEIFAYALPDEALKEVNSVADGYIPDVGTTHPQAPEIYKLYRAGILVGMDDIGTFKPNSNIKRSEVSAILTRMMDESARKITVVGTAFTITFQSNGGSDVESQAVSKNSKAIKPADPVKEGCGFLGWCTDETLTKAYDFDRAVTGDLTLYAKWSDLSTETFTVAFNSNSGSLVMPQQVKGYGKATKPEDPVRERMEHPMGSGHYIVYTFAGWFMDKELTKVYDFGSLVTEDVILYAKWTETEDTDHFYTVGFATYSADCTIPSQQVPDIGGKATRPEDPTREGCIFCGWYVDHSDKGDWDLTEEFDFDKPITKNTIVKAKWEVDPGKDTIKDGWEDIIASVNDGTYKSKYKIGDTKTVDFYLAGTSRGGLITMEIAAFDTDEKADGSGNAAITWIARDTLLESEYMNSTSSLIKGYHDACGGWKGSYMRDATMPYYLVLMSPPELREAIVPVTKYSMSMDDDGNIVNNEESSDKIWIPSAREVFGGSGYETAGPVYSAYFNSDADRAKGETWQLRSVDDRENFCVVDSTGAISSDSFNEKHKIIIGFCL